MIPVTQTLLHDPDNDIRGNCLQACLASIFEDDIENIPHFVEYTGADWFDRMNRWLIENKQCYILAITDWDKANHIFHGYSIMNGTSPRGVKHSVVAYNNQMIHDPHPDNNGLVGEVETYWIFVNTFGESNG